MPAWEGASRSISSQMRSSDSKPRSAPSRSASSTAIIPVGPGRARRGDLLVAAG